MSSIFHGHQRAVDPALLRKARLLPPQWAGGYRYPLAVLKASDCGTWYDLKLTRLHPD